MQGLRFKQKIESYISLQTDSSVQATDIIGAARHRPETQLHTATCSRSSFWRRPTQWKPGAPALPQRGISGRARIQQRWSLSKGVVYTRRRGPITIYVVKERMRPIKVCIWASQRSVTLDCLDNSHLYDLGGCEVISSKIC